MPKEDQELVYALWAMEVLVSSGVGLESAIKHVAEGGYGKISHEFKNVLKESSSGLEKSLNAIASGTKSKSLKKALTTMSMSIKGETELAGSLRTLADRETEKRKARIQDFIEKLTTISEMFLTVGILVPIIAVIMPFMSITGSISPSQGNAPQMTIGSDIILLVQVVLVITLVALGMIMFWVRNLEENV